MSSDGSKNLGLILRRKKMRFNIALRSYLNGKVATPGLENRD
jgi:hypothetical protein